VALEWLERNGPGVVPPLKEGFGITFVKNMIEYELEGTASLAFDPEGLHGVFAFPLPPDAAGEAANGSL
jgi:hypothetical protein